MTESSFDGYEESFGRTVNVLLRGFSVFFVVWSFMIVSFWWGNHDWDFLKKGVVLADGFFEARYSQHLFTVLLFDGQILPVVTYVFCLASLSVFAYVLALYLEIPARLRLCFILFIGLNPHVFVLFYYFYLAVPFVCWAGLAVGALFLSEVRHNVMKFLWGSCFFVLLLGSYPPNLNFILTVFLARRLLMIWDNKQTFRQGIWCGVFFFGQFLCAYLGYRVIFNGLLEAGYLNGAFYNLQLRTFSEMAGAVLTELWQSVRQLFSFYHFMDLAYCFPLILGCAAAVWFYLNGALNKGVAVIGVVSVFLATRFSFIVSYSSYIAAFRCEYWGKLGLCTFAFAVLSRINKKVVKNFLFMLGVWCLFVFVRTDFEIQKVAFFGFKAERLYYTRLLEAITLHKNFDADGEYMTISFGEPNFSRRYYDLSYAEAAGEFLGNLSMPLQLTDMLFWDEKRSPVDLRAGVWEGKLYTLGDKGERYKNRPLNVKEMRYWAYFESETFPKRSFIYMDDRYILLNLDRLFFSKYRETVLRNIDY